MKRDSRLPPSLDAPHSRRLMFRKLHEPDLGVVMIDIDGFGMNEIWEAWVEPDAALAPTAQYEMGAPDVRSAEPTSGGINMLGIDGVRVSQMPRAKFAPEMTTVPLNRDYASERDLLFPFVQSRGVSPVIAGK